MLSPVKEKFNLAWKELKNFVDEYEIDWKGCPAMVAAPKINTHFRETGDFDYSQMKKNLDEITAFVIKSSVGPEESRLQIALLFKNCSAEIEKFLPNIANNKEKLYLKALELMENSLIEANYCLIEGDIDKENIYPRIDKLKENVAYSPHKLANSVSNSKELKELYLLTKKQISAGLSSQEYALKVKETMLAIEVEELFENTDSSADLLKL